LFNSVEFVDKRNIDAAKIINIFFIIILLYTSNIRNVSLTYLRGLEIAELKEEDMPMV